jgi:hypothetical protein
VATSPVPPAASPARPVIGPASGMPKAAPKAPAVAPTPPAAALAAPAPFIPPAKPRTSPLLGAKAPADHFAPRDPVQQTTGVRADPPANPQASVAADPSQPAGMNPLGWLPYTAGGL